MLYLYFSIFTLIASNSTSPEWAPNSGDDLVINLPYLEVSPKIDGMIGQDEYSKARLLTNFTGFEPVENSKPSVKTEAWIGCDKYNLYIAFRCYENDMTKLRADFAQRDEVSNNDEVGFYLDTYGDLKDAYEFYVNSRGIQWDGIRKKDDGGGDSSYDTEWTVSTKENEEFWVAEFKIPFSSLSFEEKGEKKWRVNFYRIRPRDDVETYVWAPISKNIPGFLSQGGTLIIGENISLGSKNLILIPYLSSSQEGKREEEYEHSKINYKGGISLRYSPSTDMKIDFALNPDFAEIEADASQLRINDPFALYYSEKRPFFLEGKSLLESRIEVIYTRTINNPIYAGKIMGNLGGNDFLFLSARDENTPWIIPFKDFSGTIPSSKASVSNIFKVERNILENTKIAGAITDRRIEGGFNTVYSMEINPSFLEHYIINYQGVYSDTKESEDTVLSNNVNWYNFRDHTAAFDGENFKGYAHFFNFYSSFRNLQGGGRYEVYSPTFRSDLGFIQKNDLKKGYVWFQPQIYPNKFGINQMGFQFSTGRGRDFDNIDEEKFYVARLFLFLVKQTDITFSHCGWDERFWGEYFSGLKYYQLDFSTSPGKLLSFYTYLYFARAVNHNEFDYGYERNFYLSVTLKPSSFFQIESSFGRYCFFREMWEDGIYDVSILHTTFEYFFSSALSLRLNVDYDGQAENLEVMPLIKYQPSPFTIFFIGANSSTLYNSYRDYELERHQIFLKFQYRLNL